MSKDGDGRFNKGFGDLAVDIKLSTLQNFAHAMGKEVKVEIV